MRFKKMVGAACAGLLSVGVIGAGSHGVVPEAHASSVPVQGSSVAAPALGLAAPRGTTVTQGDEIMGFRGHIWNTCTLGYVDRAARVGYTAAHCAFPGEPVFNSHAQLIGFVEHSNMLGLNAGATDVAKIRFVDGLNIGANIHTGDARVPHHTVRPGEQLCAWDRTDHRVVCGQVTDVGTGPNNNKNVHSHLPGVGPGDSGSPAWIPGRGFVGVVSGADTNHPQGVFRERIASPDGL
ncbi:hypothetical protein [Corynebacterium cystitidis]|uniref:hypothetical protein n=1 Tax=Corynebacterium cystitidis TaxID=35757 RepID=UPI00211E1478|nr:hypothetical protein [Corynebacterium cystitidis]